MTMYIDDSEDGIVGATRKNNMSDKPTNMLSHGAINGWRLFWLLSVPMSVVMVFESSQADLSTGAGVSEMIGFSVRWAVPFIYLVVAASAVHTLWPRPFAAWWLRNRKYIGLCFAVAMAWQGLFIYMMSSLHRDYYFAEVFYFRDELEGSTGYIFLFAMVATSFEFGRKYLDARQWKFLHRFGMYYLWAYPFSVYWWNLFYYGSPQFIDVVFYWAGYLAVALRIAAWGKRRFANARRHMHDNTEVIVTKMIGGGVIAAGLIVAATGLDWQAPVTDFLTRPAWSANLELWLPYWPFEPFLSLLILGLGVMLVTRTGAGIVRRAPEYSNY